MSTGSEHGRLDTLFRRFRAGEAGAPAPDSDGLTSDDGAGEPLQQSAARVALVRELLVVVGAGWRVGDLARLFEVEVSLVESLLREGREMLRAELGLPAWSGCPMVLKERRRGSANRHCRRR